MPIPPLSNQKSGSTNKVYCTKDQTKITNMYTWHLLTIQKWLKTKISLKEQMSMIKTKIVVEYFCWWLFFMSITNHTDVLLVFVKHSKQVNNLMHFCMLQNQLKCWKLHRNHLVCILEWQIYEGRKNFFSGIFNIRVGIIMCSLKKTKNKKTTFCS